MLSLSRFHCISHDALPYAFEVDAFSHNWSPYNFVAYPPFALDYRTLQKMKKDIAKGIVANLAIYCNKVLLEMLTDIQVIMNASINLLKLPSTPDRTTRLY